MLLYLLLKLFLTFLIIGLFLYSKLLPYKDRLHGRYKGMFNFCNRIFSPVITFVNARVKPVNVGTGLSVDMSQIILLLLLLLLNIIIR